MTAPRARWTPKRTPTVTVVKSTTTTTTVTTTTSSTSETCSGRCRKQPGRQQNRKVWYKAERRLDSISLILLIILQYEKNIYDTFTSERLNLQAATTARSCRKILFSSRLYDVFSSGRLSLQAATTTRSCGAIYFAKQSIRYLFIRALKSIEKQQQRGVRGLLICHKNKGI